MQGGHMAATNLVAPSIVRRAAVAFALSHPLPLTSSKLSFHRPLISFPLTPRLSSSAFMYRKQISDDLLCNHWITLLDTASGICHLAQAIKGDVDDMLKVEEVKRVLEMARRVSLRREVLHTNFLTPPVVKESLLADLKAVVQGGYPHV